MTWVDFIRGTGTILIIMAIAGAIAYVGDRVGHQVGRKRLTLFNIRPRYTSTIVAIGTGMLIALFVTLAAILGSHQVQTAFFRLNALNEQISELTTRENALKNKLSNGQLILPPGKLMYNPTIIPQGMPEGERLRRVIAYYSSAVQYINAVYTRLGLKPYKADTDVDQKLAKIAKDLDAPLSQGNVLLSIESDQNLFADDPIHFQLNATVDARRFVKGQPIAQLRIPGAKNASIALAYSQLQTIITQLAIKTNVPASIAQNVVVFQALPDLKTMQSTLAAPGTYYLTAYAAEDVYPHLGGIPIVVALTTANAK